MWSRNAATDTGVEVPDWGFASSPLVVDDVVDRRRQRPARRLRRRAPVSRAGWARRAAPATARRICVTIDGVPQILLLRGSRTISVAPADGTLLWEHTWEPGVGIVQPALAPDGDVLITIGDAMGGLGMRRIAVAQGTRGMERRRALDVARAEAVLQRLRRSQGPCLRLRRQHPRVHRPRGRHAQVEGRTLRQRPARAAGRQDLLLVLSEEGELALVRATPDQFTEVARFPAIEGKTWNHPVLVGDVLLVRNGEEMAAFRLPLAAARRSSRSRHWRDRPCKQKSTPAKTSW